MRNAPLEAARAEAQAALAASVACEFNDELTLLLNHLTLARGQVGTSHPASAALVGAEHAALRCAGIARSLLEFTSRSGAGRRPVPLPRLLAGA